MKTVIEMAREAGFVFGLIEPVVMVRYIPQDGFERFADLVRADAIATEREACATECERMMMYPDAKQESAAHQNVWAAAKAIRARGNT